MIRQSFNAGWTAGPGLTAFASIVGAAGTNRPTVTLPYDVVRDLPRAADTVDGAATGFFPDGFYEYRKTFDVPEEYRDRTVILEFEGVYRDAVVSINGDFAAQRPNGYTNFSVTADPYLRYGEPNTVRVQARTHRDSRWYTGAGIHRDTKIIVGGPVRVALDGVRITTPDVDAERAVVSVAATMENEARATRTVRVTTRILDADGQAAATGSAVVTLLPRTSELARLRLYVPAPRLWSVDGPELYTAETTVTEGDTVLDEERTRFGIRTLQLDPRHGLRINGETVKLRGACIHHDNGLLGAAAVARAEERRVELLKAAGFNAIRSAHNPISKAVLDACDRLGMLVMDETFDMWTEAKSRTTTRSPSPSGGSATSRRWSPRTSTTRAWSCTRSATRSSRWASRSARAGAAGSPRRSAPSTTRAWSPTRSTSCSPSPTGCHELLGTEGGEETDVNTLIAAIGDVMLQVSASEEVARATEESASVLDVTGYNYGDSRYEVDRERFPDRVIVGSETFPAHIDVLWRLVRENPHVIGDFTWTGWDYLGEAGIGRVDHPDADSVPTGISAPYPWLAGWVGDIDITGHRRPVSYYRETVFGLRAEPYIAVHRPEFHGARRSRPHGRGRTPCRAGAGTCPRGRRRLSTSTATRTRWSCSSTAARSTARPWAPRRRSSRASRWPTRRASSSPWRTPAARSARAPRCGPPTARCG